jgi:predicted nuclease with TOPRIM domain
VERQRLPRFGVNESQLAEDAMRFIDARDVLYNEKDPERIRELGMRLESGWREKVSQKSEQWRGGGRLKEAGGQSFASAGLSADSRSSHQQLQEISLLHSKLEALQHALSDVEDENATLRTSISALSEQVASLECAFDSFQHATIEQMRRERELWSEERREELERVLYAAAAARREAEAAKAVVAQLRLVLLGAGMRGDVDIAGIERAIEALSKGLPSDADEPASATPSGASENDEEAQERRMASAMLFDVPLSPGAESRRQSMLFDQPVSLAHLRLLGLAPPSDGATPSSPSSSSTDRTSLASLPPTPLSSTPSHAALETLARRKEAADEALARALREENERLRTQMKERERRLASAQKEVETLKERVRDTEAAVEGLFAAV